MKIKMTGRVTSGPCEAFIGVQMGWEWGRGLLVVDGGGGGAGLRTACYLRQWKVRGYEGGQCHTKGGQEWKTSHP